MKKIFVHVGYPKTGTTTLQSNLFKNHEQIFDFRSEIESIIKLRENICNRKLFRARNAENIIKKMIQKSSKKVGIYSDENFTSNLSNREPKKVDEKKVSKRLRKIFSIKDIEVEIIIVIREQISLLKSIFAFWYHDYKSMGFENVDEVVKKSIEKKDQSAYNILSWMRYFDVISAYRSLFGEENVHVLLYEEFSKNSTAFVRRLSRIMGICPDESARLLDSSTDRNVTRTGKERRAPSKLYRWLSVFKSRHLPQVGSVRSFTLGQWIVDWLRDGPQISLSEPSVSRLRTIYGGDNRRVEEEFNLPLSEHGYLVS